MLLLFAALLPCLVWDGGGSSPAPDQICQGAAVDAVKLPAPGVQYRMTQASPSRSPWVDANGWRIERDGVSGKVYSYDVKGDAASLAAAEAFAYGADARIHADESGVDAFERLLPFLKQIQPMKLPVVADFGVVDDGTPEAGELINLLTRHNLLFKIVKAPDPKLKLNVQIGSPEFPKEQAANGIRMVHQIRSLLGDDHRSLRIYGSEVVLGRLTGDGSRMRLHLIDYANRPVEGLRVRVLGSYPRHEVAISGVTGAKLEDYLVEDGVTEFSIPSMSRYAVIDLYAK